MNNKKFKILNIDHVAVASTDSARLNALFVDLLGMNATPKEHVENEKVRVIKVFAEDQKTAIELVEPSDSSSTIRKFIDKKGAALHHIALTVDSIEKAIDYLKSKDIQLIYDIPKKGSDNKLITFIHPKSSPGVLIELCQRT